MTTVSEMSRWYQEGTDGRDLDGGEVGKRRADQTKLQRYWRLTQNALAIIGMIMIVVLAIIGLGVVLAVGTVTWPIWTSTL